MKSVLQNIEKLEKTLGEIKNHHMCLRFIEDKDHYMVIFPSGYTVDGIRIDKVNYGGKIKAAQKLIRKMDYYWNEDGFF